jgi:hypothetical protein
MASVVPNRNGRWEIRESRSTPSGPRSRTLASFRELDDDVLAHASERAERPFDAKAVTAAARRAGASVSHPPAEAAARSLLTSLAHGDSITPGLAGAIVEMLQGKHSVAKLSPEALAAAEWAGETAADRGRTLFQLMQFTDALPLRDKGDLAFPGLGPGGVKAA